LVDNLRNEEFDLKRSIDALSSRRLRNNGRLQELHRALRDREHDLCLEVWSAIQAERHSRRSLERASSDVERIKGLLKRALQYVHYRGTVRVAPYKRVFFSSWHYSLVEITGSVLVVDSPREDSSSQSGSTSDSAPNSPKPSDKSFSFSFGQKTRSISRSGSGSGPGVGANRKLGEDYRVADEGETDTSNTGAGYTTEAMLAAHASGKEGSAPSHSADESSPRTAAHSSSSYSASTAEQHLRSRSKSKAFLSYTTGPVRRKLQKLHDCCTHKRSIHVQDIVAVEIYKEDRSLGAAYVQIELRIHYLKEGQVTPQAQNFFFSPVVTKSTSAGGEGVEGARERLGSASSGNGSSGSRSTSTNSASGAVAGLTTAQSTPAKSAASTNTGSGNQRSLSAGGKSLATGGSAFDPLSFTGSAGSNQAAAPSSSSGSTGAGTSLSSLLSSDKLETVWLKLPLQSNTTTRAQASGKKKKSAAADDGSGGPTLTFELFISILKKVKENVRVFSVSHGVETTYRVSPAIGEATSPSKGQRDSAPCRALKNTLPEAPHDFGSPNRPGSFKRNVSNGSLLDKTADLSQLPPRHSPALPRAQPLSPMAEGRTSSVGSASSGSCRTDSGSISPKRNANSATFSSRHSSSSGHASASYHGGSMNSTSGLTSIESLVGMTRASQASLSMSASGSMSSSGTGSYASTVSLKAASSPRYDNKLLLEGALLEETSADLEGMEDDDGASEASPMQTAQATDDETSQAEEPRFLKLTRRHTEGTPTLNSDARSPASKVFATAPEQAYAQAAQDSLRGTSFCSFGLGGQEADEAAAAMASEATTRHTISLADATDPDMFGAAAFSSPGRLGAKQPAADDLQITSLSPLRPSCPISISPPVLSRNGSYTEGHRPRRASTSFDAVYPESPSAARRAEQNRAATGIATESRQQRRSSDTSSSPRAESKLLRDEGNHSQAGSSLVRIPSFLPSKPTDALDEERLIRYPVKLMRMLERARNKRSKIEMR
jgi:hypothetical protein